MRHSSFLLLGISFMLLSSPSAAQSRAQASHSSVELLVERSELRARDSAWLGLKITPRKGWHTYWKNPGDAGLAPSASFQMSRRLRVGEIAWPAPERIQVKSLASYGYEGVLVLPIQLFATPPAQAEKVSLRVEWLVCEESCIAQEADLSFDVAPLAAGAKPVARSDRQAIMAALARVPKAAPAGVSASAQRVAERLVVQLQGVAEAGELFLEQEGIVEPGPKPQLKAGPARMQWSAPLASLGKALKSGSALAAVWVPAHHTQPAIKLQVKLDR